jgi:hypothetical protein
MKKARFGFLFGVIAGIIDVIPMVLQNLSLDAILSAFSLWVVSGLIISTSNIKINSALKGIIISFMLLIPAAILIGWKEPASLVPIATMTIILGSLLGYSIEKIGK